MPTSRVVRPIATRTSRTPADETVAAPRTEPRRGMASLATATPSAAPAESHVTLTREARPIVAARTPPVDVDGDSAAGSNRASTALARSASAPEAADPSAACSAAAGASTNARKSAGSKARAPAGSAWAMPSARPARRDDAARDLGGGARVAGHIERGDLLEQPGQRRLYGGVGRGAGGHAKSRAARIQRDDRRTGGAQRHGDTEGIIRAAGVLPDRDLERALVGGRSTPPRSAAAASPGAPARPR